MSTFAVPNEAGDPELTDFDGGVVEPRGDRRKAPSTAVATHTPHSTAAATPMPAGSSITELLYKAVEKGTPVAELKELVALHEHMEKRQAAQAFANAMAAFQAESAPIKKNKAAEVATKSGGAYGFTYASLDEIARTVAPMLAKHGLSYSWDTVVNAGALTCVCTVRHVAGHGTTSSMTLPVENASGMNPQQKVGAAMTFAQRRTLSAVLGITTTDDDPDVPEADPSPITDEQLYNIEDLLEESGADKARFLTFMHVKVLADIRAVDYARGMSALRERLETRKRRAERQEAK